ncbi:MAG: DUF3795 domain-containing protein, partial [Promethearchaeota archaeon]
MHNIAFCGINCEECQAFIATKTNDEVLCKKTAKEWSNIEYKISPEDVHCEGCHAVDENIMKFCLDCTIRSCAISKKLDTCAECSDYPCSKLTKNWEMTQSTKARKNL